MNRSISAAFRRPMLLLSLLASTACTAPAPATVTGPVADSVKEFVAIFYSQYRGSIRDSALEQGWVGAFHVNATSFEPELMRALETKARAQAAAPGAAMAFAFDPFLGSEDPCNQYVTGAVAPAGSGYEVEMYKACGGRRDSVATTRVQVARAPGGWALVNFSYPARHTDLRRLLGIPEAAR